MIVLNDFERAYIRCAFWASTDESRDDGGDPLDANYTIDDLHPSALEAMREDCTRFLEKVGGLMRQAIHLRPGRLYYPSDAGHDFWLSRNRRGAGFFDRDLGEVGDKLQEAAEAFGECYLYVGDDGRIYVMGREG